MDENRNGFWGSSGRFLNKHHRIGLIVLVILLFATLFAIKQTVYKKANQARESLRKERKGCRELWWFDENHRYCQKKTFCGLYMYRGLKTFNSKKGCEVALIPTGIPSPTICVQEGKSIPTTPEGFKMKCCGGLVLCPEQKLVGVLGICRRTCPAVTGSLKKPMPAE